MRRSRTAYVQSLARATARRVRENNRFFDDLKGIAPRKRTARMQFALKSLDAYCLFTSFNERMGTIRDYLGIRNPAAAILRLADMAHLPLRKEDRNLLDLEKGFVIFRLQKPGRSSAEPSKKHKEIANTPRARKTTNTHVGNRRVQKVLDVPAEVSASRAQKAKAPKKVRKMTTPRPPNSKTSAAAPRLRKPSAPKGRTTFVQIKL
jgi:hypothetical protein